MSDLASDLNRLAPTVDTAAPRVAFGRRQASRRRRSLMIRGIATLAVVVIVVAALVVSNSGRSETIRTTGNHDNAGPAVESLAGIPVSSADVHLSGSPIASGLTVAPGTALLGREFPFPSTDGYDEWKAILVVTGDPRAVVSDYLSQAKAHGMTELDVASAAASCSADRNGGLECDAEAVAPIGKPVRHLSLTLVRTPAQLGSAPVSSIELDYLSGNALEDTGVESPPDQTTLPAFPIAPMPATGWQVPGGPGTLIANMAILSNLNSTHPTPLHVQPGSKLTGPVGPDSCNLGPSWYAVVRVVGDPQSVLREYTDAVVKAGSFVHDDTEESPPQHQQVGRTSATLIALGDGDAPWLNLTLAVEPGRPTYLLVDNCGR